MDEALTYNTPGAKSCLGYPRHANGEIEKFSSIEKANFIEYSHHYLHQSDSNNGNQSQLASFHINLHQENQTYLIHKIHSYIELDATIVAVYISLTP